MIAPAPLNRTDALRSWKNFLPKTPDYARSRNHVSADRSGVSRLSAAVRFRLLLEDEIIGQTLELHPFPPVEKWLQEVCWRRYWKGWLEMRPGVWTQWRRRVDSLRQSLPAATLVRVEAVAAGNGGVACMDAMARELVDSGYLHNHARMWWASYWIHVERLPWELGADFFYQHLLDADPASNTLSWRWVAGLQTPGKTYLVRRSNIEKFAPDYLIGNDPRSDCIADDMVSSAVVEEDGEVEKGSLPFYPTSVAKSNARMGLWLHADDLTLEVGELAKLTPVSIVADVSEHLHRNAYRLSERRLASLQTVVNDGLARSSAHFGCPAVAVNDDDPVEGICQWAVQNRLAEVVAFAPMVGPVHDMLPRLTAHLQSRSLRLTLIRRASDVHAFSLATAGFFPFWEKMKRYLAGGDRS